MQERMTAKQFRDSGLTCNLLKKTTKSKISKKYSNQVTIIDGIRFESKKEANRWLDLQTLLKANIISNLQRQVAFELAPKTKLYGEKRTKPALRYVCDFQYFDHSLNQLVIEDVKSPSTRKSKLYRTKKHLMKTQRGLDIVEI